MAAGQESGGSEPHQFRCNDGLPYMVKATNNPQAGRVVLNEAIGGVALDWLGVKHPAPAIVELPAELLAASPGAKFSNGQVLAAGQAFGSEYVPSEPQGTVPADKLTNVKDAAGMVVFDTWIRNTDGRQYRVRPSDTDPKAHEFIPVDQGHSMAHNWTADVLREQCQLQHVSAAAEIRPFSISDIRPFVERLRTFDAATADHIVSQIPPPWFNSEDEKAAVRQYLVSRAVHAVEVLNGKYPAAAS